MLGLEGHRLMLQHQDHRTSNQELNDIERGNNCVETGWWMVDGVDSNGAVDGDHFVRDLNFYLGLNIPQK